MSYKNWTDEDLKIAVKNSTTKSEVIRKLGLKTTSSGNFQTIDKYIKNLGIDISHFKSEVFGKIFPKVWDIKDILIENSPYDNTQNLKQKLLKLGLLENKCHNKHCGITEWHGKKLSLQLDHINGVRSDNRIDNLRLLCPNCHSLTDTYCRGANKQSKRKCIDCGTKVSKIGNRCQKCDGLIKRGTKEKIVWPESNDLALMVQNFGYKQVGENLGVTDNTVRKRLKNHPATGVFMIASNKPRPFRPDNNKYSTQAEANSVKKWQDEQFPHLKISVKLIPVYDNFWGVYVNNPEDVLPNDDLIGEIMHANEINKYNKNHNLPLY